MDEADAAAAMYERSRQHGDIWCPPQDAAHAAMLTRS